MITVFNRKELLCTFDMKKQAEVRDILWKFDISYEVRTSICADYFAGGRMTGSASETPEHQTEYIIYVKKEDYERAVFLVQRNIEE